MTRETLRSCYEIFNDAGCISGLSSNGLADGTIGDVLLDSTTDLGARSWVGWVRVAGEAGVIDALATWQTTGSLLLVKPGQ